MQICYFSDLHLEHYDYDIKFPNADILLLAGDICHAVDLADWRHNIDRSTRRDHAMWFFDSVVSRFRHVIYCMGNHEHFDFDFYETCHALGQELPPEIHLLEKEHIEIDGVLFYGATLWTDCNGGNLDEIAIAQQKMPEYKYVAAGAEPLTPEIVIRDHHLALRNLSYVARQNENKPVIAITHHAPSPRGLNDDVRNPGLDSAFASDLHRFIEKHENIRHWIFGHTHVQKRFQIGQCQLGANCRGYEELDQSAHVFRPDISFDFDVTSITAA